MKWLKWNLFKRKNFCALFVHLKYWTTGVILHEHSSSSPFTIISNFPAMKESIMIVQQKWGFLFTPNLNYSNSCESSFTAQFARFVGIFGILWHLIPTQIRDICWKPWIFAQSFPWSFCNTIWKGIFKVSSVLWKNTFFLDLMVVLKHIHISF